MVRQRVSGRFCEGSYRRVLRRRAAARRQAEVASASVSYERLKHHKSLGLPHFYVLCAHESRFPMAPGIVFIHYRFALLTDVERRHVVGVRYGTEDRSCNGFARTAAFG